jgi:hypothetical protein
MSIAEDLKIKLKNNQHTIFVTDADELLAVWQFKRKNTFKHSIDFSRVAKEWRCSAPPNDRSPLMPCHILIRCKAGRTFSTVTPPFEYSTSACHGHGTSFAISAPDIDTLQAITFVKRNVAPYISPILDAGTLALVCKDLGITGRAIPKVIKGRQYIAFSGYPGSRTNFPGTIYSADNRKIITMAIGALGIKNMVKTGGILTICITVPLTILEAFLQDHATCYDLLGHLASDLIKIGISVVMGLIAGLVAGGIVTFAFAPIAAAITISLFVGLGLNYIDQNYGMTEKLISVLEDLNDQISKSIQNGIDDVQRSAYRGLDGFVRGLTGYGGSF